MLQVLLHCAIAFTMGFGTNSNLVTTERGGLVVWVCDYYYEVPSLSLDKYLGRNVRIFLQLAPGYQLSRGARVRSVVTLDHSSHGSIQHSLVRSAHSRLGE